MAYHPDASRERISFVIKFSTLLGIDPPYRTLAAQVYLHKTSYVA